MAAFLQYFTDPGVTRGNGRGCPVVVHHWADLQSVLCCCVSIAQMRNVSECWFAFAVLGLVTSVLLQEIGWEGLRSDLFCVE